MYCFRCITHYKDLGSIKNSWNHLMSKSYFNSLFVSYDWIDCWWQAFSRDDDRLVVVIAEKEGGVIAIAPLMIRKTSEYGFKTNVLRFIGVPNSDRSDVIIQKGEDDIIPHLFSFIKTKVEGWEQFHLNEIPEESIFFNGYVIIAIWLL